MHTNTTLYVCLLFEYVRFMQICADFFFSKQMQQKCVFGPDFMKMTLTFLIRIGQGHYQDILFYIACGKNYQITYSLEC